VIDLERIRALEERGEPYSVLEACAILNVSKAWLNSHIKNELIRPRKKGARYQITSSHIGLLRASPAYRLTILHKSAMCRGPSVPFRLRQYHRYHSTINEFTWLLKAYYSEREELKRRHFRLDILLQRFIEINDLRPDRIRRICGGMLNAQQMNLAITSLQRVWYNEMAYGQPPLPEPFLLDYAGVNKNLDNSSSRYAFPSWRISKAYYCIYHAFRSLCDSLDVQYRREEHISPYRAFKATKLSPCLKELLKFPFNLRYGSRSKGRLLRYKTFLPHERQILEFAYASHPRPPGRGFNETLARVIRELKNRWQEWPDGMRKQDYMIPDLLLQFRNWVNYVDIENMIALKSEGFRAYLDQDLGTIIWFYAAFAELAAIAQLGPSRFLNTAECFWKGFIAGDKTLWHRERIWPLDARLRIYMHIGLLPANAWSPEYPSPQEGAILKLL
jgi:hypothetical protein